MTEKSTSLHTICRLLLREMRVEKGVTQAHISQLLGKASVSSWSKVENGETPLTLEHLLTVCTACQIWPANFFVTAQNYMTLLGQNGWYVAAYGSPLSKEDDQLGTAADEYYSASASSRAQAPNVGMFQVLQTPWPYSGLYSPLNVFRWALDAPWRQEQMMFFQSLPKL